MAFLIAGAIRYGVKAAKDGVQAHKDYNASTPSEPVVQYDRYGNPKQRGPVYGLVLRAEEKLKGKGRTPEDAGAQGSSSGTAARELAQAAEPRRSIEKTGFRGDGEDYGPQEYTDKGGFAESKEHELPPPTYDQAVSPPTTPFESSARGFDHEGYDAQGFGGPGHRYLTAAPATGAPPTSGSTEPRRGKDRKRSDSSSSSSSESSDSDSEGHISRGGISSSAAPLSLSGNMYNRKARKAAKRQARAERRLMKRQHREEKRELRAEQRHERSMARYGQQ